MFCYLISKVHFIKSIETEKSIHRHKHGNACLQCKQSDISCTAILLECVVFETEALIKV